ncbi:MAG: lipoprotein-releasing system transmembrane subunit LolC, partial [Steroidobacteraceae bacterium]
MSSTAAWIGLRYLRARRENRFVGFISGIAMAGIALGVATLIAVLSVMNGFERDLSQRILDVVAHATLEGDAGRLDDW